MFELKISSGTIQLKWGYWAMKKFCERHDFKPTQYFEMLSNGNGVLDYVAELLVIAHEYAALKNGAAKVDEVTVCEWIDEAGGVKADGVIMDFLKYLIATHTANTSEDKQAVEEKKS